MRQSLRVLGTFAVLGGLLLAFFANQFQTLEKGAKPPLPAQMLAPNGHKVNVAALANKPMVVNFWATWCPPCRQEMPALVNVANRYADKVQFIGIAAQSPISELVDFQRIYRIPYPIVLGDERLLNTWRAEQLPLTYFLNSSGEIVRSHRGAIAEDDLSALVEMMVEKAQ